MCEKGEGMRLGSVRKGGGWPGVRDCSSGQNSPHIWWQPLKGRRESNQTVLKTEQSSVFKHSRHYYISYLPADERVGVEEK